MAIENLQFKTKGGITVSREIDDDVTLPDAVQTLMRHLDGHRGVLLSSSFEFPGRYTRWDLGFVDPPLMITSFSRTVTITALNERGVALIAMLSDPLQNCEHVKEFACTRDRLTIQVMTTPDNRVSEEQRSRQPSVFSVIRAVKEVFASSEDRHIGLYGAFGYDLVFQFEPTELKLIRDPSQRDLVLYLPDEILLIDYLRQTAAVHRYDFEAGGRSTVGLRRATEPAPFLVRDACGTRQNDFVLGEYATLVEEARGAFERGDLFEVVLTQTFTTSCTESPSTLFRRLKETNPAPYGALMNLGEGEFLIAASPEMFVRVDGRRIETCPLSGTIARGRDALEDADNIRELLNSSKDESELTMCTDVDRNDKSRVCEPASVRVIGRRQIEMYSRLIHTADHVEGILRPEFDALDGFLSHTWAVTVTGAPKPWAIKYIEAHEKSARGWYGGALGRFTFDGDMNTGLTLRTIRINNGIAEVRVGATLLHDSDPVLEDQECQLKASALLSVLQSETPSLAKELSELPEASPSVLLIDHEDSFVHTLASYYRAIGATVRTLRPAFARAELKAGHLPDLVVLSPGPGRPADFAMAETIGLVVQHQLALFGVCLGLQGIVEYFRGTLQQLDRPTHGKPSLITNAGGHLLRELPSRFMVGRYHSLYARKADLPAELMITAETDDGIIMAIEHRHLPIAAVQFHPESLMTGPEGIGLPIVAASLQLGSR